MELDENKMVISDEEGNEHLVTVLFTYHNDERNRDYVVFIEDGDDDNAVVMIYDEETGDLSQIEDDEEYEEFLEVYNAFLDEEETSEEN